MSIRTMLPLNKENELLIKQIQIKLEISGAKSQRIFHSPNLAASLLAMNVDLENSTNTSRTKYVIGFHCTLGLYRLALPIILWECEFWLIDTTKYQVPNFSIEKSCVINKEHTYLKYLNFKGDFFLNQEETKKKRIFFFILRKERSNNRKNLLKIVIYIF